MKLVRYNPFNEIDFWGNSFNSCFNDPITKSRRPQEWVPVVDILSKDDTVILNVELPGVNKEDICVNIEEKVLTIKGERKLENEDDTFHQRERIYGNFKRSFSLSDDILTDEVSADYADGILTLTLKKDTTKEKVKEITIN
ncbi:MAG: Hsp20/alpha crystallin family protein [Desulfobacula sp.]|nr:Hsp20/alpha crystallin family protein [Desulfobacula sp.]